uniref:Uncharacterized protein n=1 Tax=Gopherus agassizii TaxID=38772 RepID=A0A452IL66_9SAUR
QEVARHTVGPLNNQGTKGALEKDKVIVEKLNEFFKSVFTAEDLREIPTSEPFF